MKHARSKIDHYVHKNQLEKVYKDAPEETREYLSDVNLFGKNQNKLRPEEPIKPFICDENLKFSQMS